MKLMVDPGYEIIRKNLRQKLWADYRKNNEGMASFY